MMGEILLSRQVYLPVLVTLGTYLFLFVLKKFGISRLRRISATTETYLDDLVLNVLSVTRHYFMITASFYAGVQFAKLPKAYQSWDEKIFIVILTIQAISWAREAVASWVDFTVKKKNDDPSVRTTMGFIGLILKFVIIAAILLFALNNLGVNVSTFIAGLGVGGIAIALATQNILGDLFSSLSIVLDKPFIVGDFITVEDWMGTVEHVGLKTTRIRSLSGEQIIVSNTNLLSAKINNFKRMQERRILFRLGVTYQTKRENLKKAPSLIEEVIRKYENTRFDRSHFLNYGAFSLDIDTVYFVLSPEFIDYADVHQKILLDIHEAFEKNGLEFAYPTQTLFIEKNNSET